MAWIRFDGDGMVHACRIKDGRVSYCNKWVRTNRIKHEDLVHFPVIMKVHSALWAPPASLEANCRVAVS